jgi:hypothetical protein
LGSEPPGERRRHTGCMLRLTLLAPEVVEAILGGRQQPLLQLDHLIKRFPVGWKEQRVEMLGSPF